MAQLIRVSKKEHIFVPVTPDTAGAIGSVTETPAGTGPTLIVSASVPLDSYSLAVKIVVGGAVGTATFKVALDGVNYGPEILTPTGGAGVGLYTVPGTGIVLDWPSTGDYVADTVYTATCTAPQFVVATANTAIAAARTAGLTFGGIVILNDVSASATATFATGLSSTLNTLQSTYGRDVHGYLGCLHSATDADVRDASWPTNRLIALFARGCYMTSGVEPGRWVATRSSLWPGVMRAAKERFSADIGSGQYAALDECSMLAPNGTTRATSEIDATIKLRNYGFSVLEARNGLSGAYFARGMTKATPGSLYEDLNVSRVISRAHEVLYAGLQKFVNHDVLLKSTGVLADAEMVAIKGYLQDRAEEALIRPVAHASRVVTTVSQANVISSDRTLNVLQEIQIKGQLHNISATLSATGTITITT
jgi:hypothetical protein